MHFEQTLIRNTIPEWSPHYLNYSSLKRTVFDVTQGPSLLSTLSLEQQLNDQIEVVQQFVNMKTLEVKTRLQILQKKIKDGEGEQDALKKELQDITIELRKLSKYIIINDVGLRKITKKFYKHYADKQRAKSVVKDLPKIRHDIDSYCLEISYTQELLQKMKPQETSETPLLRFTSTPMAYTSPAIQRKPSVASIRSATSLGGKGSDRENFDSSFFKHCHHVQRYIVHKDYISEARFTILSNDFTQIARTSAQTTMLSPKGENLLFTCEGRTLAVLAVGGIRGTLVKETDLSQLQQNTILNQWMENKHLSPGAGVEFEIERFYQVAKNKCLIAMYFFKEYPHAIVDVRLNSGTSHEVIDVLSKRYEPCPICPFAQMDRMTELSDEYILKGITTAVAPPKLTPATNLGRKLSREESVVSLASLVESDWEYGNSDFDAMTNIVQSMEKIIFPNSRVRIDHSDMLRVCGYCCSISSCLVSIFVIYVSLVLDHSEWAGSNIWLMVGAFSAAAVCMALASYWLESTVEVRICTDDNCSEDSHNHPSTNLGSNVALGFSTVSIITWCWFFAETLQV